MAARLTTALPQLDGGTKAGMKQPAQADKNRRTVMVLAGVALGMFVFGFALVPLYGLLCQVAGIQSVQTVTEPATTAVSLETDRTRVVLVKFDTTVSAGLPWEFRPLVRSVSVHPGEIEQVMFLARNLAGETITGQAIPTVLPWQVSAYFSKTECFCFRDQALAPGESREMVLQFLVSPHLPPEITELTLSYTFMNSDAASAEKYRNRPYAALSVTDEVHGILEEVISGKQDHSQASFIVSKFILFSESPGI